MENQSLLKVSGLALVAVLTLTSVASGAITYIDAAASNTTLSDGTAVTPVDPYVSDDNLWGLRTFGNNATVYSSNDSNTTPGEDAPELRTRISGLTAGSTNYVYVYYWVAGDGTPTGNQQWDIATGLSAGATSDYLWNGGTLATNISFVSSPLIEEADRRLFQIDLGIAIADVSGNIDVYVDDFPGNVNRTWYDGVGYSALVDSDNDGMEDSWEVSNGLNVGVDDSALDEDANGGADGLTNIEEFNRGTDPQDSDTDNDGLIDGVETDTKLFVSASNTGTDPLVMDTDGDSFDDGFEVDEGSDPTDPNSVPASAIVFVSVATDLSNIDPVSAVAGSANDDNTWRQRNDLGETGATILEGWNDTEDIPVLTQTLSGLVAGGTYDIYVNYIRFGANTGDPDGTRGGIRGSLDGSTFSLFNEEGGTAGMVGFSELTGHTSSDRVGLRGYLGTAVADGSGNVVVYVDDDGLAGGIEERVWFDGVSYYVIGGSSVAPATILSITSVGNDILRIVVDAPAGQLNYWPKATPNLVTDSWMGLAHSIDGSAPWYVTNLTYVTEYESVTNEVIYVQADEAVEFFGIGSE